MQRTFVVVAYSLSGEGTVSREFRSSNPAQEYAIDWLEKQADTENLAKVLIMESMSVFVNSQKKEAATFVHAGPEYVHRDQLPKPNGNGPAPKKLGHAG